jgi:hypothetical protein
MNSIISLAARARAAVAVVLVTVLGVALTAAAGAVQPASAAVSAVANRGSAGATADALPTVQVNGIVWTQVVVGNVVYAGGRFSTARPAGAAPGRSAVRRSNLLAFDIRTGKLISSFAPSVNGTVRALAASPDRKTLYVGGAFSAVNGKKRLRFAAVATGNGALRAPAPAFSNEVRAILATGSTVYVGGSFSKVGSTKRSRLAALSATTGKLRKWKPAANGEVLALTLTPDRKSIVAGGSFSKIGRTAACGMSRLSLSTGSVMSWPVNTVVKNCGRGTAIMSLTADASRVYGSGYSYGGGNYEGVFAASSTGRLSWLQDCRGDTYDVAVANGRVYSVGHAHNCANIGGFPETKPQSTYRALAVTTGATGTVGTSTGGYKAFRGKSSPSLVNWFPSLTPGKVSGQSQAAWSVVASGPYVVLGGEFTAVNGSPQQGLVRMASPSVAPRKQGPVGVTAAAKPAVAVHADRSVTVSWSTVWDRDDQTLTYTLWRGDTVVSRQSAGSLFWKRKTLSVRDSSASPGEKHSWRVVVSDPDGNQVTSASTSSTLPPVETTSPEPTAATTETPPAQPAG